MIKLYALLTKYWAPKPRSKRNLGEEVQGASGSQEQKEGEEGNKLGEEGAEGGEGGEEEIREEDPEIAAEGSGSQDGGGEVGSGQPCSPEIPASPVHYPHPWRKLPPQLPFAPQARENQMRMKKGSTLFWPGRWGVNFLPQSAWVIPGNPHGDMINLTTNAMTNLMK